MAASQDYLTRGLCPQAPGIFIEGIETEGKYLMQNRTFLLCPKPDISTLLRQVLAMKFTYCVFNAKIVIHLLAK